MNERLNVAVVGSGNMGANHARVYAGMPDCTLVAVVDPSPVAASIAARHGATHLRSSEELYRNYAVDAVSIAVPTPLHAAEVARALASRCHVLVEKPIAGSVEDAELMIKLAEESHRVLTVGHIERFNPVVRALRDLVAKGTLGTVTSIVMRRVGGFPAIEPATDVIMDLAIHDLDLCGYLLGGAPSKVLGTQVSRVRHSSYPDSASILLENSGAACFVQANWVTPIKVRTVTVTGSEGHVEANYVGQRLDLFESSKADAISDFDRFTSNFAFNTVKTLQLPLQEPLQLELSAFVGAVRSGADGMAGESPLMGPEEAVEALRLALSATELATTAVRH